MKLESEVSKHTVIWKWVGIAAILLIGVLFVVGEVIVHRAGPILKGRVEETLRARFHSRVELGDLNVSIVRGIEVSGDRLRIYAPDDVVAAGVTQPLIAIDRFSFHSGLKGLFIQPMHVCTVQVNRLDINIPPKEMRQQVRAAYTKQKDRVKISVDRIIFDDSRLVIGTEKAGKTPLKFSLKHIELHDVGPDEAWKFEAVLVNAIPRGDIHASGKFGPWQTESPGDSPTAGHYTFEHADLSTINGIGGTLSSIGTFKGQLNRIVVDGTTDTPDFRLDTANFRMPLRTQFHATVDGTNGDTYLDPVNANLRNSGFTATGKVINIEGQGHRIDLDVSVNNARLQDFLDLSVNTQPAVMTADISTHVKVQIPPGKESVPQKLRLAGPFTLRNIHFTNPQTQDKIDMLSLRASGHPREARPGARDVNSQITGQLNMADGALHFSDLEYVMPGATVNLEGTYSLDGQTFDFHGELLTKASLSHMVASPWLSFLLKTVSPFFRKAGGGAEIPVSISGTKSEPKFGLDLFSHHDKGDKAGP